MIVIYSSPGCASCRKVKSWLNEHNLIYVEKNILTTMLTSIEIKYLLLRSENGSDDIISKRSKVIVNNKIDIDAFTTDQLVAFIIKNPSVLRRPILISENFFQVGYDAEEIETLINLVKVSDVSKNMKNNI